mgnify:CR=1 FL=1
MKILDFLSVFPTEESCKLHFKSQREHEGVICKGCASKSDYWLSSKWQWQCKSCSFSTTLKSGTITEYSKVNVQTWYKAMLFMSFSKNTISATELQHQLNHLKYDTIWRLMHNIPTAMGNRNDNYNIWLKLRY